MLPQSHISSSSSPPPTVSRHSHHVSPPPPPDHSKSNNSVLISAALLLLLLLLYLCVAIAIRRFRACGPEGPSPTPSSTASRGAAFLRHHGLHHHRPAFTYEQLHAAIASFDPRRKLGDGGFGTVFLAYLLPNGRPAASYGLAYGST